MQYVQTNELFVAARARHWGQRDPQFVQAEKKADKAKEKQEEKPIALPESWQEIVEFKKDFARSFPKTFDPDFVEKGWYQFWEAEAFATADAKAALADDPARRFVIILPPPNVTGSLHIGHALTGAIQDCIARRKRMQGFHTVYLPGTDHAGIATQSVVEKMLAKEGLERRAMGKAKFLERVWQWKEQYGSRIELQLRRLGSSLDWRRFSFTMDAARSTAVVEAFARLHERGLIYRDNRLVNWDCKLRTALSDIEVEDLELKGPTEVAMPGYAKPVVFGELVKFAYPLEDDSGEVVVATTRLETMLGDVAVAVNSQDERYKAMVGKALRHPLIESRKMRVIADDELVDMKFGTGAVKITPAHDPNDFLCGKRHGLDFINILTEDGAINEQGGEFKGLRRYEARAAVAAALERRGLLRGTEPNPMVLKLSSRSGDAIEPMIEPQWYVRVGEVSKRMVEAVKSGELRLIPEAEEKKWFNWLAAPRDWCISRQLWWGHQIPAYKIRFAQPHPLNEEDGDDCWFVGRTAAEAEAKARARHPGAEFTLTRDEDVLDTWFSSGLLPFSNFGWPNEGDEDFRAFYPNTVLETGNDILFFWVARMVMFGLMLTERLPFRTVFLHSIVRDEKGEKMSKSKGNVVDPLELIDGCSLENLVRKLRESQLSDREKDEAIRSRERAFAQGIPKCGADALRYALLSQVGEKDINLSLVDVLNYRKFGNKIWNSYFRVLTFLPPDFAFAGLEQRPLEPPEQWLMAELEATVAQVNKDFDAYRFAPAVEKIERFWYNFCDNYLEFFKGEEKKRFDVLFFTLDHFLRLLHPVMPFLTEELYQKLPRFAAKKKSICVAEYPGLSPAERPQQALFRDLLAAIGQVNRIGLNNVEFAVTAATENKELAAFLVQHAKFVAKMSKAADFAVADKLPDKCLLRSVTPELRVALVAKDLNFKEKIFGMERKVKELSAFIAKNEAAKSDPEYKKKVRPEVQAKDAEKLAAYKAELESEEKSLAIFKELA